MDYIRKKIRAHTRRKSQKKSTIKIIVPINSD